MEKLNFEEKIAIAIGTVLLASIFLYSIPANLNYSFSTFFNKGNKEKIVELNNKKYLGKLINGPFDYSRYIFSHPPIKSGNLPLPPELEFNEIYISNLNNLNAIGFSLDEYKIYKNYKLKAIVNDTSNTEFNARQDTLEMLIEKFNSK